MAEALAAQGYPARYDEVPDAAQLHRLARRAATRTSTDLLAATVWR